LRELAAPPAIANRHCKRELCLNEGSFFFGQLEEVTGISDCPTCGFESLCFFLVHRVDSFLPELPVFAQAALAVLNNRLRCCPCLLCEDFKYHDRVSVYVVHNAPGLVAIDNSQFVAPFAE
jgi:hypothetical protein